MNTSDLSIEAANAASVAEHDGVKVLKVSSAKIPQLASELQRKGFKQINRYTWVRPLGYVLDPNGYTEN